MEAGSNVPDVSDFSTWKDNEADDPEDIDHDLDGPEYNSDYDTEPDVDSEGVSNDSEFSDNASSATDEVGRQHELVMR